MAAKKDFEFEVGQHVQIGRFNGLILDKFRKKSKGKFYEYECQNCGYVTTKVEHMILEGSGCPCCYNRVVKKGFNDIPTTDPWMIPYFQGGEEEASQYTKSSHKEIYPICPFCGEIRTEPLRINAIYYTHGFGCQCKDNVSIPNKVIYEIMRQLKECDEISYFHREYTKIHPKCTYDMYFEIGEDRYLVEMDSNMHSYIRRNHGSKKISLDSLFRDRRKTYEAERNNIPLIRIDCNKTEIDYIRNEINKSELCKILDLSKIDWNAVIEFAYGNLIKEICTYRKENPTATTTIISEKFGISVSTAESYMKHGNSLGWCQYDPKEEWIRTHMDMDRRVNISTEVIDLESGRVKKYKTLNEFLKDPDSRITSSGQTKKISKMLKENNNQIENYKNYKIKRITTEELYNGRI